jgi:hypothetical protein
MGDRDNDTYIDRQAVTDEVVAVARDGKILFETGLVHPSRHR